MTDSGTGFGLEGTDIGMFRLLIIITGTVRSLLPVVDGAPAVLGKKSGGSGMSTQLVSSIITVWAGITGSTASAYMSLISSSIELPWSRNCRRFKYQ